MRVLSQSEIDAMLASLLANPQVLPGFESAAPAGGAPDDAAKPAPSNT